MEVGDGNLVDGWEMGLLTMSLGEISDIYVDSKYGYGVKGRPPLIPPNSSVIFRVEIVKIGQTISMHGCSIHMSPE
jgi:FKBP-type peptidyl-prolyl cis-trans isomerase